MATDNTFPAPPPMPAIAQVAGDSRAPSMPVTPTAGITFPAPPPVFAEPDDAVEVPSAPSDLPTAAPGDEVSRMPYDPALGPKHGAGARPDQPRRRTVHLGGRVGMLMAGEITIDDLDDEELQRGQLRAIDGTFKGRKANVVPRVMHDEMIRRLLARGQEMYRESFLDAIKVFTDIAKNDTLDPKVRMQAATEVTTRIAGKVPDKVELTAEVRPWEGLVSDIAISVADPGDGYFQSGNTVVLATEEEGEGS